MNYNVFVNSHYLYAARMACSIFLQLTSDSTEALSEFLKPEVVAIHGTESDDILAEVTNLALEGVRHMTYGPQFKSSGGCPRIQALSRILPRIQLPLPSCDHDLPFVFEVTEEEARVLARALESQWRLSAGQFAIAMEFFDFHLGYLKFNEGLSAQRRAYAINDDYRAKLTGIPGQFGGGSYFGVGNKKLTYGADEGLSLSSVITHRLSWDKDPKGGHTRNFDEPMLYGQSPVLPRIEKVHFPD